MLIALEANTGQLDGAPNEHWLAMLAEPERQRFSAMASTARQRSFLLGRVVLRTTLADQLAIEPEQVAIEPEASGRPILRHGKWRFSLSHVEDQLVLVLSDQARAIGVDLEWPRGDRPWRSLAQRRLPGSQAVVVTSAPPGAAAARFCTYWTLLEALAKARGCSVLDASLHRQSEQLVWQRGKPLPADSNSAGADWRWWHSVRAARHYSLVVQGDTTVPAWTPWQPSASILGR